MFIEPNTSGERRGSIEVICGSMFSGKTEELIRRLKRVKIANLKVEIFKPAASGGPMREGTHRAGFPHRHFVAFAELRCRIAIQLECLCQRRFGVGQERVVARR